MDFSNRCLGCLSNDQEVLRLLENSFTKLFEECTGLKVEDRSGMPKNVCDICYRKCTSWNKFKLQCIETNKLLSFQNSGLDQTEKSKETTITIDNVQTLTSSEESNQESGSMEIAVKSSNEFETEVIPQNSDQTIIIEEFCEEFITKDEVLIDCVYASEEDEKVNDNDADEISAASESIKQVDSSEKGKQNECVHCKMRFRSTIRYEAHLRQHQGLKPEVCNICLGEFNSTRALRRHMQKHVETKKHACKECGKRYKFATSLTMHRRAHQNSSKFVCDLCGKSFLRSYGLKVHLLTHTTETPFKCETCEKQFKNEIMLKNHIFRKHGGIKNFHCTECPKAFTTGAELKIHIRSHTNQKPYKCQLCEKRYKTQSHLAVHFRSAHTSDRPYKCDLCPKAFAHNKVLKHHRLIHTGELPWVCDICKRAFRQKCTLQSHRKIHEKDLFTQKDLNPESVVKLRHTLTVLE